MGFDKDDPKPLEVHTEKKTTKVNIAVIIGVLCFLLVGLGAVIWIWQHPHENAEDVQQGVSGKTP